MLSIFWIASIIGFFCAMPFTEYFFNSSITSFLAMANVFIFIGVPLFTLLMMMIRRVFKTTVGANLHLKAGLWTLWVVNLISGVSLVATQSRNFNAISEVTQEIELPDFEGDTLYLNRIDDPDYNSLLTLGPLRLGDKGLINNHINFRIVQSDSDQFELTQIKDSNGRTHSEAESFAQGINYTIESHKNRIDFPSTFAILKGSKYRGQEVKVILKVPVGKTVKLDYDLSGRVDQFEKSKEGNQPWVHGGEHFWTMEEDGFVAKEYIKNRNYKKTYNDFEGFSQLQIDGHMKVEIKQADEFMISVNGLRRRVDKLEIEQMGKLLSIDLAPNHNDAPLNVSIEMPLLESLDMNETKDISVSGFSQKSMTLKNDSRHTLKALVNVDSLNIRQQGRSEMDIRGKGLFLRAQLSDRSRLDADRFTVKIADIKLGNSSRASLTVSDTLFRKGMHSYAHVLTIDGEPATVDVE